MTPLELLAAFEADERAVQQALSDHGLLRPDPNLGRLERFSGLFRDVLTLPDAELCVALEARLAAGEDPDASPGHFDMSPLQVCFRDGKLNALRMLLRAGARTRWNKDERAIALGNVPTAPDTDQADLFLFACRVGNLDAAKSYASSSQAWCARSSEPLTEAVRAGASPIVAWLMDNGFDPNAVDDIGRGALELAVDRNDVTTAELLLSHGADPFGPPERDYSSAVDKVRGAPMRALFVRYGVNPGRLAFETSVEHVPFPSLAERPLTSENFAQNRSARAGQANPERFLPDFWSEQIRTGRYASPTDWKTPRDRAQPIWSFQRYGRSVTPLPDGRLVFVGGEHEDWYDPDFCIYADVTVLNRDGGVDHYIYPEDVFPPTDFHSATLIGGLIWLVGGLGYPKSRRNGETPVYTLDVETFSIQKIALTGEAPGWIHRHRAVLSGTEIIVSGGKIEPGYRDNDDLFGLDLGTLSWRRIGRSAPPA